MPVVSTDWRDPAGWLSPGAAWGVVRDGERLRFCRKTASGKKQIWTCLVDEWAGGAEPREKLERDVSKGAVLSAGLQPHRVLIRELHSPLADPRKSSEIWESLLDAAIPIPLESCQVAFLPPTPDAEEGLRCVAAAARIEGLEDALAEWNALGLDPDFLYPEVLMLSKEKETWNWLGETRTVFAAWRDGHFLGAGGCLSLERRRKAVGRFHAGLESEREATGVENVGPEAGGEPEILESQLAEAGFKTHPLNANLRTGETACFRRRADYTRKWRRVRVMAALLAVSLIVLPLFLSHYLQGLQRQNRRRISGLYHELTGRSSPAPGQEPLLARRFVEEEWTPVWNRAMKLSDPVVSTQTGRLLEAAEEAGTPVKSLAATSRDFDLMILGAESVVTELSETLLGEGHTLEAEAVSAGVWRIKGEWR